MINEEPTIVPTNRILVIDSFRKLDYGASEIPIIHMLIA